jgi:hypothetical protein
MMVVVVVFLCCCCFIVLTVNVNKVLQELCGTIDERLPPRFIIICREFLTNAGLFGGMTTPLFLTRFL